MSFEGEPVRVAISPSRFGDELNKPGESYLLSNSYSHGAAMLGGDRYSEIFFRTKSENIYFMDGRGYLLNAEESVRRRSLEFIGVPKKYLMYGRLTVGLPFYYDYGHTTNLSEIVVATSRIYSPDCIEEITKQRTSSILRDFYRILEKSGKSMDEIMNQGFSSNSPGIHDLPYIG